MGTDLFQYECESCGDTVVTKENPQTNENEPLVCPDCSAVDVNYTVNPNEFEDPNIIQL